MSHSEYLRESVPGEAQQLFLVCPQHRLVLLDIETCHDMVQVHNHVLLPVAHHHEEAPLLLLQAIFDERRNALIPIEIMLVC